MRSAGFCFSVCLTLAGALAVASAQEIKISSGVTEEQVLQRDIQQVAALTLTGVVTLPPKKANGKVIEARLMSASNAVSGFDWIPAGRLVKQNWTAEIKGIPVGGPYRLEVRVQGGSGVAAVDNILVGDLWVLGGQSNMEGFGDLIDVQPPDPLVHTFDLADRWQVAEEPLHTLPGAVDPVHWRLNKDKEPERWTGEALQRYILERRKGAGLGLPFAVEMVKRTAIPIGLIPCAHVGTSMEQWDPSLRDREGLSLYGSMYRRVTAAGGRVKGMLWYQGESDANPTAAPLFLERFKAFVKAVRSDFKDLRLPFYYVQIGRHINPENAKEWNIVQESQRLAESQISHSGMVASVDTSLDDGIHVNTPDLKRLGLRLADRVCHDEFHRLKDYGEMKRGPVPASIRYDNGVIKVSFSDVNDHLESEGRISGFTIHDSRGAPVPLIYKARVDPAEASTVLLYLAAKLPEKATLHYGFGKDPYCNVHDALDNPVPVFGPLEITTH